jgi:hypothetical protein
MWILFMEALTPLIKFYVEICVRRIFQEEELSEMNKDQEGQPIKLGDVPLGSPYMYQISTRIQAWGCQATSLQPS